MKAWYLSKIIWMQIIGGIAAIIGIALPIIDNWTHIPFLQVLYNYLTPDKVEFVAGVIIIITQILSGIFRVSSTKNIGTNHYPPHVRRAV